MPRKHAWVRLKQDVAAFRSAEGGNLAMIFGLTLVPTLFMAGAAVDYSGAASLKTKLQRAADGAAIQLCKLPGTSSQAEIEAAAQKSLSAYMEGKPFRIDSVVPTTRPRQIELTTSADFPTAIVRAVNAGFANVPVRAASRCFSEQQTFEIALVLDTTGSMLSSSGGVSKLQAMKTAAKNFVNAIFTDPTMMGHTKMSLVPFAASVALPTSTRTASWADTNGQASYHWNFVQGGAATAAGFASSGIRSRFQVMDYLASRHAGWGNWTGCFESRPYPFNVRDGVPASSEEYFVPMFAPDEAGNGGVVRRPNPGGGPDRVSPTTYIDDLPPGATPIACPVSDDEAVQTNHPCKYVATANGRSVSVGPPGLEGRRVGPHLYCTSRTLTRLTTNQATLTTEIDALNAEGSTNIHEGFMWGWRTISPTATFTDGLAYRTPYNNKVIVLMTDGANTWNANTTNVLKSVYSAYGYFNNPDGTTANARVHPDNANPTTSPQGRAALDQLTRLGCKNARDAGVVIYTIAFSVPGDEIDAQGINLMKECAGNESQYFLATSASTIDDVFKKIAQSIGQLRLAM